VNGVRDFHQFCTARVIATNNGVNDDGDQKANGTNEWWK
jgi:hypothetical protein